MLRAINTVGSAFARFPGLAQLRLRNEHLPLLAHQGFVAVDRDRADPRSKLRFRAANGRQIVRCIPEHLVETVRADLANLQALRRGELELSNSTRMVRAEHRTIRRGVGSILSEFGFHFHGTTIRRRRHTKLHVPQFSF
jgi:hypothetical protein